MVRTGTPLFEQLIPVVLALRKPTVNYSQWETLPKNEPHTQDLASAIVVVWGRLEDMLADDLTNFIWKHQPTIRQIIHQVPWCAQFGPKLLWMICLFTPSQAAKAFQKERAENSRRPGRSFPILEFPFGISMRLYLQKWDLTIRHGILASITHIKSFGIWGSRSEMIYSHGGFSIVMLLC